jgi:hypothetical protein
MENKKVTAVEWFTQKLNEFNGTDNPWFDIPLSLLEQAKEMEKEQMISAMIYTFNQQNTLPYGMEYLLNRDGMLEDCENYYKETYGE